jgi:hypothetical protein
VGESGIGQSLPVAEQPEPGAFPLRIALNVDGGDPPAAEGREVAGHLARGSHVVDHDMVGGTVIDPLAEQHHRGAVEPGCQVVGGQRERADDQAVDEVVADAGGDRPLLFERSAGLVDQDGPSSPSPSRDASSGTGPTGWSRGWPSWAWCASST